MILHVVRADGLFHDSFHTSTNISRSLGVREVMCGIWNVIELIYLLLRLYMLSSASLRHAGETQNTEENEEEEEENLSPLEPKLGHETLASGKCLHHKYNLHEIARQAGIFKTIAPIIRQLLVDVGAIPPKSHRVSKRVAGQDLRVTVN